MNNNNSLSVYTKTQQVKIIHKFKTSALTEVLYLTLIKNNITFLL